MEYVNFFERINNVHNLKLLSEKICNKYEIGQLVQYKHIEVGYEDFNMLIETSTGKYFAKLLNKSRPEHEINRLAKILEISYNNKISVPKIYKINNKNVNEIYIENKKIQVILMDYIDGVNMLFINRDFTNDEIKNIAKEMALINKIDYNVEPYYDEWTITNFESEYNKKINYLAEENKVLVTKIYNQIKAIDFEKFPKTYTHADIIKSNLILDQHGKIWVIDFSVLNYLPRVIELGVAMFGVCMTDNREQSINNINLLLNEYNSYNKLEKYEIDNIPVIFNAISATHVLQTDYIKNIDESFEENEYWLKQGRKGIKLDLSSDDIVLL